MTTTQCTCQSFFFGTYGEDGSAESFEDYGTGCNQTTGRTFAQGHDAKLVGFMVRAELNGEEIAQVDGGMRVTFPGAVEAAASISPALGEKADAMMKAAVARLAKKAAAKNPRLPKKAKAAPAPVAELPKWREARIKVGRWPYTAQIEIATGDATYTRKLGGTAMVSKGEYTEVN